MLTLIVTWLARVNRPGVPATSRDSGRRDHAPFGVVAVTFVAALAMLMICLFWPYILPLVVTPGQAAVPDATLAFILGTGAFVFPLMLLFTAINYTAGRSKSRPSAAIISMRSNGPTRSKRSPSGHAGADGG